MPPLLRACIKNLHKRPSCHILETLLLYDFPNDKLCEVTMFEQRLNKSASVFSQELADAEKHTLYQQSFDHDACGIGAVAHIRGERTHQMLDDALSVLINLEHRGGVGLEPNTGDGAGVLFQIPHRFFRKEAQKHGQILPDEGNYAVAMLFLPQGEKPLNVAQRIFEEGLAQAGLPLLFWRPVPVDPHDLGETARACMPQIYQAFIGKREDIAQGAAFERVLYVARRQIEKAADANPALEHEIFYVCSMSASTIVYKGMLVATQMRRFYLDLNDASTETALALVHSRYSTNTTPSWERAHPNRYIIHNGEINTLRGNVNWIRAREHSLYSPTLGDKLASCMPIINKEGSDSAILDNVLEFLTINGRPLTRAVSLVLPEPWDHNPQLSDERRAFDMYQSMLMEPWDGPAAIAFTDGHVLGAALDRNGLRPARYYITRDDRFILASEVGVLDIEHNNILQSGLLGPGQILEVDPALGRVKFNDEIRNTFASEKPYRAWLTDSTLTLDELQAKAAEESFSPAKTENERAAFARKQASYGYHFDDVDENIRPMATSAKAPLASMGVDSPLPILSTRPQSFFNYFNQLFAQVTNPPIDALRESLVTSSVLYLGNHGNLLEDYRDAARLIKLDSPLLDAASFAKLAACERTGFKAETFTAAYDPARAGSLKETLDTLCAQVLRAVKAGVNIVILSNRCGAALAPIPSLLALGAVHNALIRAGLRTQADLVLEAGDPISAHDFACLIGFGASAIYPFMAHETIRQLAADKNLVPKLADSSDTDPALTTGAHIAMTAPDADAAIANYNKAIVAGVIHIMSKMGISTMQGYHSAQIFEILGLADSVVNTYFTGATSRIGGLDIDGIEREANARYEEARLLAKSASPAQLTSSGLTKWRPLGGEEHLINPETIYLVQRACREGSYELFKDYVAATHKAGRPMLLRDLLAFKKLRPSIPIDEVESAKEIVKRFNTGAMSYGSISQEAHETLAIAMNRLGGRSNTGEGGEHTSREVALANGDSKLSAIKQVASARFGVTSRYLSSAIEIQIKMAQGAKPGEGGHLPGKKVWPWVAEIRRSTPGVGLISPPPHHDIYSIEDLAELIFDLKNANPEARVSVKLVSEAGVGTIATGVAKGGANKILISGHNGGTGAAPRDSIYHAGLPLELGLAETQQTLVMNGLRSRVVLEADGKLLNGRDLAIAALLGAEEFGFATMPLIVMGCLMQRDCQQDTCPVGVCTQNEYLRSHFKGNADAVVNFMMFMAENLREHMAELGFRTVDEMVGHPEYLEQIKVDAASYAPYAQDLSQGVPRLVDKPNTIDLSSLLTPGVTIFGTHIEGSQGTHYLPEMKANSHLDETLDATLFIPYTESARTHMEPISFKADIANVNRCVGTMLGSRITKAHPEGLPDGSIKISCEGSGGQSFGAFLPKGVSISITGEANDYFGKGLSGGILSVNPPADATYKFDENICVGNVAFMGATSGKGFINGLAGQRFAVRNSGATLVVEGVGNHGCEYMTGGLVLILGEVGQNFAAGMSGGVAYVFNEYKTLDARTNHDMVELLSPTEAELEQIRALVQEHVAYTQSPRGIKMLYRFDDLKSHFVKVIPHEFKKIHELAGAAQKDGMSESESVIYAFNQMRRG